MRALRLLLLAAPAAAQLPPGDDPASKESDWSMQINGMKSNLPQYAVKLLTVPVALGMAAGAKAYVNATRYGQVRVLHAAECHFIFCARSLCRRAACRRHNIATA